MLRSLFTTALAAVLAGAVLWIGLPLVASSLIGGAAAAAGLGGATTQVSVSANPPLRLLLLQADAVHIRVQHATWRGLSAGDLDLTLAGLRAGTPPRTVTGRLDDVDLPDGGGGTVHARTILIAGPPDMANLTIQLSSADVQAAIARGLPAALSGLVTSITLVPPDGLLIRAAGQELRAHAAIGTDGALILAVAVPGPSPVVVTVLDPDPSLGLVLGAVRVNEGMLELSGTVDLNAWGL